MIVARAEPEGMLFATTGVEERQLKTILSAEELMVAQRLVRQLPVGDQVVDAILKLVRSARPGTGIDQELDDMGRSRRITRCTGPRRHGGRALRPLDGAL